MRDRGRGNWVLCEGGVIRVPLVVTAERLAHVGSLPVNELRIEALSQASTFCFRCKTGRSARMCTTPRSLCDDERLHSDQHDRGGGVVEADSSISASPLPAHPPQGG